MIPLSRPYASRHGVPVLERVDPAIFTLRYFSACLQCTFCHDACCEHGVDISGEEVGRVLAHADALEVRVGVPRAEWFVEGWSADAEFPSGRHTRTRVRDGACVFLDRRSRGCHLHAFALAAGADYHDVKPMVSALFPITFDQGALLPSEELRDGRLVCSGVGPTLFSAVKGELAWYFGQALVDELAALQDAS